MGKTTTRSWLEIINSVDPDRKTTSIVYVFGGKKKIKDRRNPYETMQDQFGS